MITVAPVLLTASAASANTAAWLPSGEFEGQTAVTDPMVLDMVAAADAYWTRNGYDVPRAEPFMYDSDVALAQGEQPDAEHPCQSLCRVWVSRGYLAAVYEQRTRQDRRMMARSLCFTITHERGHNLGLPHEAGGMMGRKVIVSRECAAVVRRFVPGPMGRVMRVRYVSVLHR